MVIIDGVETLSDNSSNAMLKVLEEPPAGTIMILIADRAAAVLPTINSRCQLMRFGYLTPDEIRTALIDRGVDTSSPKFEQACNAPNLGQALELFASDDDEITGEAIRLWNLCVDRNWSEAADCAEELAGLRDVSKQTALFTVLIDRLRSAFLAGAVGQDKVFSANTDHGLNFTKPLSTIKFENIMRLCERSVAAITGHASTLLVMATFVIALMEELHVEQQ